MAFIPEKHEVSIYSFISVAVLANGGLIEFFFDLASQPVQECLIPQEYSLESCPEVGTDTKLKSTDPIW